MTIEFYTQLANGYQCFSNMYPAQFYLGGLGFYSNEHFFQFSKFIDTDTVWARKIMYEPNPFKVKRMGGDRELSNSSRLGLYQTDCYEDWT